MQRCVLCLAAALALTSCGSDPEFTAPDAAITVDVGDGETTDDASGPGDARDTANVDGRDIDDDGATDSGTDVATDSGSVLGTIGTPCVRASDCVEGLCIPVGQGRSVCSQDCDGGGCPSGWTCDGEASVCLCGASIEICDGLDNDCDGQVDEGSPEELGCGAFEVCVDDGCMCPATATTCDGACTDTTRDRENCGDCGEACGVGESCVDSECLCPDGSLVCDGVCIDVSADPENCGQCELSCPEGLSCADSECVCPGEIGLFCFEACTDGAVDIDNCGECGVRCRTTEVCDEGECSCPTGWGPCTGGLCFDLVGDPRHCGGCGQTCAPDERCVGGRCACLEGNDRCGGSCIDVLSDSANCGACGVRCAANEACSDGECGCPSGTEACGGVCIDTTGDRSNCGGCGVTCGANEVCDGSECRCACDPASCAAGTCFRLPRGAPRVTAERVFTADPQQADIAINMDVTGSMGGEISALRSALSATIVPRARDLFANVAFSVSSFADFPCSPHGATSDLPFVLRQRVTTNESAVNTALSALAAAGGADTPESGVESLYQLATGSGTNDCRVGAVASFNPAQNRVPGVADGVIGGVGFRSGSLPIVLHITDATSHARGEADYPYGATRAQALAALGSIGAKVIGVASLTAARSDLLSVANGTGTRVLPCAWDAARPAGCAAGQCCTQRDGAGRAPDSDGLCPLVFDISESGTGLGAAVVSGIDVLARFAPVDVRMNVRADPAAQLVGIDTRCLVRSVRATGATLPAGACGATPSSVDFSGDGNADGYTGITTSARMAFRVEIENTCIDTPGAYQVHLDVVAGESATYGTVTFNIYVP